MDFVWNLEKQKDLKKNCKPNSPKIVNKENHGQTGVPDSSCLENQCLFARFETFKVESGASWLAVDAAIPTTQPNATQRRGAITSPIACTRLSFGKVEATTARVSPAAASPWEQGAASNNTALTIRPTANPRSLQIANSQVLTEAG